MADTTYRVFCVETSEWITGPRSDVSSTIISAKNLSAENHDVTFKVIGETISGDIKSTKCYAVFCRGVLLPITEL